MERVLHIMVLAILTVSMTSCEEETIRRNGEEAQLNVEEVGTLSWRCILRGQTEVFVNGYVYKPSRGMTRVFEEWREGAKRSVERAKRTVGKAPTKEIRESLEREIREYQEGFHQCVGYWEHWNMVLLVPVLIEGDAPTKAVWVGCHKEAEAEVALTIYSAGAVEWDDVIAISRRIASIVHGYGSSKIECYRREDKKLFDDEGHYSAPHVVEFTKGGTFIRQR